MPATGAVEAGRMLMIMGTSTCDIMLADAAKEVPGMCGAVLDGVVPGLVGFEAGQSCVGDGFNWFVENCVPEKYARAAREAGVDIHAFLTERAARLLPGESGLIALDWLNGNRSVLVNHELSGLILGLTLATKPEEIYRALIESTAFGARVIMETFEESSVPVRELVACGGIAKKNAFLMQIYADVLGREIRVACSTQAPALGAAMFGAVAAGEERGGYRTIADAAREMGGMDETSYRPDPESAKVYDDLYREYLRLHDFFGRGGSDAMKRLRAIRGSRNR
jgi:L-ribulokinase